VQNGKDVFAILHRLGVPLAPDGQSCALGSMCANRVTTSFTSVRNEADLIRWPRIHS
jgi:hypothetical protein